MPNDIIIAIDRQPVAGLASFIKELGKRPPGAKTAITLLRDGKRRDVLLTLDKRPKDFGKPKPRPSPPLLMLDTGGHMALVKDMAFTPDGRLLVSAGDDKVIRIWDWRKGKTIRTIRGQSGPGDAGKIYAMALSPNGKLLAAGGWMKISGQFGYQIRLYNFASGKLLALLRGHGNVVNALAFSNGSRQLISGSSDKTAIIWDVTRPEHPRLLHRLKGHKHYIYAVGFTPDGKRAVTGSLAGC